MSAEDRRDFVSVKVSVHMLATQEGELHSAVQSGYRPLCYFGSDDAQPVGLCELELVGTDALAPGASGDGVLRFDVVHADLLKTLALPGTAVGLGEGTKIVARATVMAAPE